MIRINENYLKLQASYLFSDIAKRVRKYQEDNPGKRIIKLGIGDVTRALPQACIEAFHAGVEEMASDDTFRGYGPEQGYDFLREAIAANDYAARGAGIRPTEVFVSDGAKCDTANIQELFASDARIAIPDPVYPVYIDTNVMAGRTGAWNAGRYAGVVYLDSTPENGYVPSLPEEDVDLIYLCFPNNPTGATVTRGQLGRWVRYAIEHKALILYDAAYACYIRDDSLPHTIYEIDGAREVAIEFQSFSKSAGFTGTRCAYTVIPEECRAFDANGAPVFLHSMWNRRHTTKFNGVSYPVQRAAEAVYSAEGKRQTRALADYYLENARLIRHGMTELGYAVAGGENSPYLWIRTGGDSWEFFDRWLNKASVVVTPGSGFGACGQGHIRISAFNSREAVKEAMERIGTLSRQGSTRA